jgi:hypothetical protein
LMDGAAVTRQSVRPWTRKDRYKARHEPIMPVTTCSWQQSSEGIHEMKYQLLVCAVFIVALQRKKC